MNAASAESCHEGQMVLVSARLPKEVNVLIGRIAKSLSEVIVWFDRAFST